MLQAVIHHNRYHKSKKRVDQAVYFAYCDKLPDIFLINKILRFTDDIRNADAVLIWGAWNSNKWLVKKAIKYRKPIVLAEDGFIRSVFSNTAPVPIEYRRGMSFVFDQKGFHFCGGLATDLEDLINSCQIAEKQRVISKKFIELLVQKKISKYNSQKPYTLSIENSAKENDVVLVIDQSYGDQSLEYGLVEPSVFERMLQDAVNENPGSRVLFKVHPDNIALHKRAYFSIPKQVEIVSDANPLDLLSQVKSVYVATSQLGFEALLLRKRVKVYGMPFYAGWGLTTDVLANPRRKRRLTIEELLYIVYFIYSKYATPDLGRCSATDVVEKIIEQREEYFGEVKA